MRTVNDPELHDGENKNNGARPDVPTPSSSDDKKADTAHDFLDWMSDIGIRI